MTSIPHSPISLRASTILILVGATPLWLLAAVFVGGMVFLPTGDTGQAVGMVIALLPFVIVPPTVLCVVLGLGVGWVQRLRGALPSSREAHVYLAGAGTLVALALAVVAIL